MSQLMPANDINDPDITELILFVNLTTKSIIQERNLAEIAECQQF